MHGFLFIYKRLLISCDMGIYAVMLSSQHSLVSYHFPPTPNKFTNTIQQHSCKIFNDSGPARKNKVDDEETNWNTAYHEAGHTLVAFYTKDAIPIHKVTILPRGKSLGHVSCILMLFLAVRLTR